MATKAALKETDTAPRTSAPKSLFAETLSRLSLVDPREALLCLPSNYSDLRTITKEIPDGDDTDARLYQFKFMGNMQGYNANKKFVDLERTQNWRDVRRLNIELIDSEGDKVNFGVFGNPWPYRDLGHGEIMNLVGKIVFFGGEKPKAYLQDVQDPPPRAIGKIWTQYLGIPGRVSGEKVEALVLPQLANPDAYRYCANKLVGALGLSEEDALEAAGISEKYSSFEELLKALHTPATPEHGWMARTSAHKLTAMAIQASAHRHNLRSPHKDTPIAVNESDIHLLAATQKESLTASQLETALSITKKLGAPCALNGLLSGDVGTGKTLAYLLPAIAAHRAGAKVTIMAPTTILADQIANQILTRFKDHILGVERVLPDSKKGKIHNHQSILVGTSGIANLAAKLHYTPDFLICDEQHKLPTLVREKMVKPWTHTLEVSATPIPRSLAAALFDGKDLMNLRECPVKKTFTCVVSDLNMRATFARLMREAVARGERVAVIYPRVNVAKPSAGDIKAEASTVLTGASALEKAFPGLVVAIHGGMEDEDIRRAIEAVRTGEKPIVVASTVIETGVDIPGITVMVVRDAEMFGISQLHQLRGRLVRHGGEGFFAMMVNDLQDLDDKTFQRLKAIEQCTDGYELAEKDLVLRGFGDMSGENQSGASETVFKLVNLRPEDFLRKKLSEMSIRKQDYGDERKTDSSAAMQPRLFG